MNRKLLFLILWVMAAFVPTMANELTVYEGTMTSQYVPAYIAYWDDFAKSQVVIPAADLEEMTGSTITSIKFYTNSNYIPYTTVAAADVYLMEVNYTEISAYEPKESATIVYQGTLDIVAVDGGGEVTIELTTPFVYNGGNLLIGTENQTDAGYKFIYFLGQQVPGASIAGSNGTNPADAPATQRNFIPKTTFTYVPGDVPIYYKPKDLAVSEIGTNEAKVTWTAGGTETAWNLGYKKATDEEWTEVAVTETSYQLEDLTNGTNYEVRVQSDYGEGNLSGWVTTSFTTALCAAEDQGEISYSLVDSYGDGWNGNAINVVHAQTGLVVATLTIESGKTAEGTVSLCYGETYNFVWVAGNYPGETSYTITDPEGTVIYQGSGTPDAEIFATYTMTKGFMPKNLAVSEITANSAKATWEGETEAYNLRYRTTGYEDGISATFEGVETGQLPEGWETIDADGDGYGWYVINYQGDEETGVEAHTSLTSASYINNVGALTPDNWVITPKVKFGNSLSFDAYGQDASYAAEVFRVYISTTGKEITDFEPISEDITATGEPTTYTFDLSEYAGKYGYVALRHYNVTDQFVLNVENFVIAGSNRESMPAGEWVVKENVTSPYTIEGLEAMTEYEVQVQAIADEREVSNWTKSVLFTTLEEEEETGIEELYLVGSFNSWAQTEEGGRIPFELADGEFTATTDLEAGAEFKLITPAADGEWQWFGGQDDNQVGYFLINNDLLDQGISLVEGANFRIEEGGTFNFVVTEQRGLNAPLQMTVSKAINTAITDLNSDNSDNTWYNIQGMKINGVPTVPGIYINGGKKVVVK